MIHTIDNFNKPGQLWKHERDYWTSVKKHLESGVSFNSMFPQGNLELLFPIGELSKRLYILHEVAKGIEEGCEFIAGINGMNIGTDKIRKKFPIANNIFDHPTIKQSHPTEFLLALSYITLSQLYNDGWETFAKKIVIGELKQYCKIN